MHFRDQGRPVGLGCAVQTWGWKLLQTCSASLGRGSQPWGQACPPQHLRTLGPAPGEALVPVVQPTGKCSWLQGLELVLGSMTVLLPWRGSQRGSSSHKPQPP